MRNTISSMQNTQKSIVLLKLTLINSKKSPKMLEFMAIFGDFNLKSAFT